MKKETNPTQGTNSPGTSSPGTDSLGDSQDNQRENAANSRGNLHIFLG
jgi:hypothetical protein